MDFRSSSDLAKPLHCRHGLALVGGHEVGEFVDYNIHVGPVIKPLSAALHGLVTVLCDLHRVFQSRNDIPRLRRVLDGVRHIRILVKLCPLGIDQDHLFGVGMVSQDRADQPIQKNGLTGARSTGN